ncbi:MAG: thiol:disulfide interchange protein DsbA/DsbL [Azoarcus sp.]|jgi:thiol:disulfide interchange protein DsbA|nr:thiol:disulfide interchange protein DsbA/DsbL [Azoarcus sp.]
MNRRDVLRQLGALALCAGAAGFALAQERNRFITLSPPVQTGVEGKIEVVEFFYYGCPHCRDFDPLLQEWLKNLPADVVFTRVPVSWGDRDARRQGEARLYYALQSVKRVGDLHEKVFAAIQDARMNPVNEDEVREWAGDQGLDAKAFMSAYKSFGVQTQVRRAMQLAKAYKIEGVPTLAVDGRFVTSASQTGSHQAALAEVDRLIGIARRK